MARKKSKTKSRKGGRRRRVAGVHPAIADTGMMLLGAAVGGVVATFGAQGIKSAAPTMPAWLGGGVMAVLGASVPLFTKATPLVTGVALGAAGVGTALAINETFLSLPGIAGVPANSGLQNAQNRGGYFSRSVGTAGYRGIPRRMGIPGTFSGNGKATVGAIISN